MKVLIAGGGIGGLATALSLHAVGVECEVFDQSTTARATVWLDSPALPGPVVARLRTGPQPLGELLGPLGMRRRTLRANRLYDYGRPLEYDDQDRAVLRCPPRWKSRTSGWPWSRRPISSPCCGDRIRKPRLGVEGVS